MTALSTIPVGETVRLVAVTGDHQLLRRLAELGLTVGCELTVIQTVGGPVVIGARGSRIALGATIAAAVTVEHLS